MANPGTQTAGTQFGVSVTAVDTWGNTATAYTGNQTLTFSGPGTSPGGNAPSYPTGGVVAFTNGTATIPVTLYKSSTTTNLTVTEGGTTGSTGTFTVSPAADQRLQRGQPGHPDSGHPVRCVHHGNRRLGQHHPELHRQPDADLQRSGESSPGGTAPKYPTGGVVSFTAGTATANVTLYNASTTTNLTATAGTLTDNTGNFTVNGGATAVSYNVANLGTQTAGTQFGVSITAIDTWGNTATGYAGTKTLTFSGPASSPGGTSPKYPTNGSVTFTAGTATANVTLYNASTTTNLTATAGAVTGSTGTFTVSPAGTSAFNVANPGTQTAGTQFGVSITAIDAWGNTTPSYTGNQTLTFSGPALAGGTAPKYPTGGVVSFTAGTATANVTFDNASTTTDLTATQGTLSDDTGAFTVSPGGASDYSVANPGTQTAGTQFGVSITAIDTWGNTATAYTGNQTLTFSGPGTSPGGNAPSYPTGGVVAFTNGTATANVTLYNASTTTDLTATQGTLSDDTGTFTVSPGSRAGIGLADVTATPATTFACTGTIRIDHLHVHFCQRVRGNRPDTDRTVAAHRRLRQCGDEHG